MRQILKIMPLTILLIMFVGCGQNSSEAADEETLQRNYIEQNIVTNNQGDKK